MNCRALLGCIAFVLHKSSERKSFSKGVFRFLKQAKRILANNVGSLGLCVAHPYVGRDFGDIVRFCQKAHSYIAAPREIPKTHNVLIKILIQQGRIKANGCVLPVIVLDDECGRECHDQGQSMQRYMTAGYTVGGYGCKQPHTYAHQGV
jgi:hypothetical protein